MCFVTEATYHTHCRMSSICFTFFSLCFLLCSFLPVLFISLSPFSFTFFLSYSFLIFYTCCSLFSISFIFIYFLSPVLISLFISIYLCLFLLTLAQFSTNDNYSESQAYKKVQNGRYPYSIWCGLVIVIRSARQTGSAHLLQVPSSLLPLLPAAKVSCKAYG